ncbi:MULTISPECIES: hypothetical protein [unclassified Variovorax]|uniref:hypothetical protein n=1 Tax=unclassified Variovorax TaxID=663243 RepID=UPI000838A864|nr:MULTISPECIES: hypothetical protein [unclassified Variovorax]PNG56321.1 hypothetical protein CHC07_02736 [Variovorax sp. B4]PNG57745.1 hypothetical protein CHC06_02739 [Variovorax sp. B2]VTV09823.1 hypothetical protein WDL1CHR_00890 [Variovorax sp. WDL1]
MAFPPLKSSITGTYPNPSNAAARIGFADLYDYVTSFPFGQCRLVKSGANLVLQRHKGLWLTIDDTVYTIPSAGVSLSASGLTPGTVYNIYAYMSGATMTIEASATAHATDTTTGVEVKSGDATRTLVGKARVVTGPGWSDSATGRFVISWFNRRNVDLYIQSSGALSTSSGTPQPLLSVEFLCWGDEILHFSTNGTQSNNTVNSTNSMSLGVDSTSALFVSTNWQAYANGAFGPCCGVLQIAADCGGVSHRLCAWMGCRWWRYCQLVGSERI